MLLALFRPTHLRFSSKATAARRGRRRSSTPAAASIAPNGHSVLARREERMAGDSSQLWPEWHQRTTRKIRSYRCPLHRHSHPVSCALSLLPRESPSRTLRDRMVARSLPAAGHALLTGCYQHALAIPLSSRSTRRRSRAQLSFIILHWPCSGLPCARPPSSFHFASLTAASSHIHTPTCADPSSSTSSSSALRLVAQWV